MEIVDLLNKLINSERSERELGARCFAFVSRRICVVALPPTY